MFSKGTRRIRLCHRRKGRGTRTQKGPYCYTKTKRLLLYKDESYFHQGRIESSLSKIVGLLKEANRRADQWKDDYQDLLRKFDKLHKDHKALEHGDLCSDCQMVSDATQPGKTIILCQSCGEGKQTVESLKQELEKEQEKTAYWKESYETALKELSDINTDG